MGQDECWLLAKLSEQLFQAAEGTEYLVLIERAFKRPQDGHCCDFFSLDSSGSLQEI